MENADVFLGLHDFLERMRQPAAADFVKAIKRFVFAFTFTLINREFQLVHSGIESEP